MNATRKGSVGIPKDFFLKEARKEYSGSLTRRLVKEINQNAKDAHATKLEYTLEGRRLSFKDNGTGMDEETLRNGLLELGGSIKDNTEATGFFGAAKKLIILSHIDYSIHTRDIVAKKDINLDYTLESAPYHHGTNITIEFAPGWPDSMDEIEQQLRWVVSVSNIPMQVYFNGELLEQATPAPVGLEDEFAIIREYDKPQILVRFDGLIMFEHDSPSAKGYFYDVKVPGRDCLNQNRQQFRDESPIYTAFWKFKNSLSANVSQGVSAAISYRKVKDTKKYINGILYLGYELPNHMSKRQKSLVALTLVVARIMKVEIGLQHFGFFLDDQFGGIGNTERIFLNPNHFNGDDWEWQAIKVIKHELTHFKGLGDHDERYVSMSDDLFLDFIKDFSGINPIRAKMRMEEKSIFGN